jgi:hypothetical protein
LDAAVAGPLDLQRPEKGESILRVKTVSIAEYLSDIDRKAKI